jgi:hypothetical protein
MRLFSRQGIAVVDLTQHVPDSRQSGYETYITRHYARLYGLLGTDQFIWCQTDPPNKWDVDLSVKFARWWELEVPRDGILKFVDIVSWERITSQRRMPNGLWFKLRDQADREFSDDEGRKRRHKELIEKFWEGLNTDDCWQTLLRDDADSEWGTYPLVTSPLQGPWVIGTL